MRDFSPPTKNRTNHLMTALIWLVDPDGTFFGVKELLRNNTACQLISHGCASIRNWILATPRKFQINSLPTSAFFFPQSPSKAWSLLQNSATRGTKKGDMLFLYVLIFWISRVADFLKLFKTQKLRLQHKLSPSLILHRPLSSNSRRGAPSMVECLC